MIYEGAKLNSFLGPRDPGTHPLDEAVTPVVFRFWTAGGKADPCYGQIDAIVPLEPSSNNSGDMTVFSLMGGHSGCTRHGMLSQSRPATPEEWKETAQVMRDVYGYNLRVMERLPSYDAVQKAHREALARMNTPEFLEWSRQAYENLIPHPVRKES